MFPQTALQLDRLLDAADALGVSLPDPIPANARHLATLRTAVTPAEVGPHLEAVTAHLGDPVAYTKARKVALAKIAEERAGVEFDNLATDLAIARLWGQIHDQRDAVADAFGTVLAPALERIAAAAVLVPADARPDRLDQLTPDQYRAYRETEEAAAPLAMVDRALDPLYTIDTSTLGNLFTVRAVSALKWADVSAHRGLPHSLLEALDGRRNGGGSLGVPTDIPRSTWAYLASREIPLAFGNPTTVAERVAHLHQAGQDPASPRVIVLGHERSGSGWKTV